jgi:hypothetical protein
MPEKHQQDDDRDRYAEQPKKNGHLSFLHVLVIDPAIENLFPAAQRVQLSRQRCSGTITVFCTRATLWRDSNAKDGSKTR